MSGPKHIQLLSDQVANKIAAGEVVDRPASVLKELVENALDAGATQVDVEIVAGGKKAVIVSDSGHGMSRDDALLSIERHATSKIRDVHDIERVETLGFRGEALAAISSVSRFSLLTRLAEAVSGTEILISGGKMRDVKEAGCPPGTTIAVRNLFFNVPARRKFLRAEQTELSHIKQAFLSYALSHPSVGMTLVVDSREVHRLPGGASLEERLRALFDADFVKGLRAVERAEGSVRITGFTGTPHISRADRSAQYVFINGRPASAPVLAHAIREGYHTLLTRDRHPVLCLFLEIDPGAVDVNVHPTKKEVRFRKPSEVRDVLIEALRSALSDVPLSQAASSHEMGSLPVAQKRREPLVSIPDIPPARTFQYPRLPLTQEDPGDVISRPVAPAENDVVETAGEGSPWAWCRILGQVGGLYVVLETEDGVVLMDPHAAHERVLYERFMKQAVDSKVKSQGLLSPETVELPPDDARCVREHMAMLVSMGFGLSEFGGDTFIVDALPTCLGEVSSNVVLRDVAGSLERGGARGGTETWAQERVAQAACKAAVKARNKLTLSEIEKLVVDLARADMPYTCPHGRPTLIFMSFGELDKKFGRT